MDRASCCPDGRVQALRDSLAALELQTALARKWEDRRVEVAESVKTRSKVLAETLAKASRLGIDPADSLEQAQQRCRICEAALLRATTDLKELRGRMGQHEADLQEGDKR